MNSAANTTLRFPVLILAATAAALSLPANGAVLFTDNFESYTADTELTTLGPGGSASANPAMRTVRDEATATPFGTPNQYAELNDAINSATTTEGVKVQSADYSEANGTLTTLSFDFYEPSTGGGSSLGFGYGMSGGDLNGGGSRLRLFLDDGSVTGLTTTAANTYSLDAAYTIYVIFNDTASAVSYDGGTIAAGHADVWLEVLGSGAPMYAGTATATNSQADYFVAFRTFSTNVQEVWVDNVSLFEGAAAVPEPSAALLGFLGMLALLRRRRG